MEKYQNFNFFNFVILESKNAFFLSTITTKTFSRPIYPTIKRWKKIPIFYQNHGLTPLKKSWFFDFLNFLFFIV